MNIRWPSLVAATLLRLVVFAGELPAENPPADFETTAKALRDAALKKAVEEFKKRESDPDYIEQQKRIKGDREEALRPFREGKLQIRARLVRAIGGERNAVLAFIRIKTEAQGESKKTHSIGDELEDPCRIDGVNLWSVATPEGLDLLVYPVGDYLYTDASGAKKTIRRFATSPEMALKLAESKS